MTVAEFLEMMSELHDWHWHEDAPGHILITRKLPAMPKKIPDVPLALRAALPKDWRRFLGHLPEDNSHVPEAKREAMNRMGLYEERIAMPIQRARIAALARHYAERLRAVFQDQAEAGAKLSFKSLSAEQVHDIVTCLVLDAFDQLYGTATASSMILGKLPGYQLDPCSTVIRIKNEGISVSFTDEKNIERGFAASLPRPGL